MQLLNIYEDKFEAEDALEKISGLKRLASERDGTDIIYNLFGQPTWGNFYKLSMYNLPELKLLLELRESGQAFDKLRHKEIITMLQHVSQTFTLTIPEHWL